MLGPHVSRRTSRLQSPNRPSMQPSSLEVIRLHRTRAQTRLTDQCILRALHHGIRRTVKRTLTDHSSDFPSGSSGWPLLPSIVVHLHRPLSSTLIDKHQRQSSTTTINHDHRPTIDPPSVDSLSTTIRSPIDSNSTRTGYGWNSEGESGSVYVFRLFQNTRSTQRSPEGHNASNPLRTGVSAFTHLDRAASVF